jgi:hypothetical protein
MASRDGSTRPEVASSRASLYRDCQELREASRRLREDSQDLQRRIAEWRDRHTPISPNSLLALSLVLLDQAVDSLQGARRGVAAPDPGAAETVENSERLIALR